MKVAFDASTLAFAQMTGTGVYAKELIQAYQTRFPNDDITHAYRLSRRVRGAQFLLPRPAGVKLQTLVDPITWSAGSQFDIFHGLNTRLPVLRHCKKIATVHDLFSLFGGFAKSEFVEDQKIKLQQMISRADQLIVPAQFTKNILIEKLGLNRDLITVVPLGVRQSFVREHNRVESEANVRIKFGVKKPFLLFVGALEKRKNVIGVVETFARVKKRFPELQLILVGHEAFGYAAIRAAIESSGVASDIKQLGFVGEKELASLYNACKAFLFLSLEEGFGIPVIEAMACGAPVVSSNRTSLPEVGGGFSWLVDPDDRDTASQIICSILEGASSAAAAAQALAGQKFAHQQTWIRVAEKTREVYEQTLSAGKN